MKKAFYIDHEVIDFGEERFTVLSPNGEEIYESDVEGSGLGGLVEELNEKIAYVPSISLNIGDEYSSPDDGLMDFKVFEVELPFDVLPAFTTEEARAIVQSACVVCMTRFDSRFRVRENIGNGSLHRAAAMLVRETAYAAKGPLPTDAHLIIPIMAEVFSENVTRHVNCEEDAEDLRDDPLHDFAELYLEDLGRPSPAYQPPLPSPLQVQAPLRDKEKPKTPTAWLGVEPF